MGRLVIKTSSTNCDSSSISELTTVDHPIDCSDSPSLEWPFDNVERLDADELREAAYEIFFTSCRSTPGLGGGRNLVSYYPDNEGGNGFKGGGSPTAAASVMAVNSRVKRALGLRTRRSPPPMRPMKPMNNNGGSPSARVMRPMTSAEIMRYQMRVTDQSDNRLRKVLMRTLVGQMGRRTETIILPLELLRQLKPSEFNSAQEYHMWQRRQLKILEAGLVSYPSIPLDRLSSAALRLREIVRSSEQRPIDTGKNSEVMRILCGCVINLAWRNPDNTGGHPPESCRWADGYPLNVHLYLSLLRSIFDQREETVVLDEVDELLELMKRTWTTLGINRMIHNVCFTWVLFEQYVMTGQAEQDLICGALSMLVDIASDAKRIEPEQRDPCYARVLAGVLTTMYNWAEKKMLDYHEAFDKVTLTMMENTLCLALTTAQILSEDVNGDVAHIVVERDNGLLMNASSVKVDHYIRSSLKSAFTKILENENARSEDAAEMGVEDPGEVMLQLAKETEDLAMIEQETFSPMLKRWHPVPTAVAVATLHSCFGVVLKQYLSRISSLTHDTVQILQATGKLEKVLIQMVVEDSAECDDGGKSIVCEMVPFEVDSFVTRLMKGWVDQRLAVARDCLNRVKETENWLPKSKSEPYAQTAVELMKLAKTTVDEFFEIPLCSREDLIQDLADGLDTLFLDYTAFIAACGTKQSYIPALPALTRCNQDSKLHKFLKKMGPPCKAIPNCPRSGHPISSAADNPRPSTSRGTQRLYIRLNTLHYLLAFVHSIDKTLSAFASRGPSPSPRSATTAAAAGRRRVAPTHFDLSRSAIQSAINCVAEVAAYRLVFLDSAYCFYGGLYVCNVAETRIRPALRTLKQQLTMLIAILTDRAQPPAVREVMKATFEAFLMVLLAGGGARAFTRADAEMVEEDFYALKRVFSSEGLVAEEAVEKEAEVVEDVLGLMGLSTENLIEDFVNLACDASGLGRDNRPGTQQKVVPMPPTTARWNKSDPNTVLRILCHRNDDLANRFLKRTFQLPKAKRR